MNRTIAVIGMLIAAAQVARSAEPEWNHESAASYLDGRAKTWYEFGGAFRGEKATKTTCISCHTLLPFLTARPNLSGAENAKADEYRAKALAQVGSRVAAWAELDTPKYKLMYDFNEAKKKESWGTEAVVNSYILALDDRKNGLKKPSEMAAKALANLWKVQVADGDKKGSFDWLDFGLQPWEAAPSRYMGAAWAALAVETAPGYIAEMPDESKAKLKLLEGYLRAGFAKQNLHQQAWGLLAASKLPDLLSKEQRAKSVDCFCNKQQVDGGWQLASLGTFQRSDKTPQDPESDGYATGLIVHVLLEAGVAKDDPAVVKGLTWLRSHQEKTGEWKATSLNKNRDLTSHVGKFMSDAATAFAVLALSH